MKIIHIKWTFIIAVTGIFILPGCKKYLDIPLPVNTITGASAFNTDVSASAVVTGNFMNLFNIGFLGSQTTNVGYTTGLYSDELQNLDNTNSTNKAFYTDAVQNTFTGPQWSDLYSKIFQVNAALDGIENSKVTLINKNQWVGESLFNRAFLYFYLVNLYGDVPLALSIDYKVNNTLSRTAMAKVYQQIIADLLQAQSLLSDDYKDGSSAITTSRARPNKGAATALLARVYLYTGDWANAAAQATAIINNPNYQLVAASQTFLTASKEIIWGLAPTSASGFVIDYKMYNNGMPNPIIGTNVPKSYGVIAALSASLVNAFEAGDARFTAWVRTVPVASTATTYYFPNKYKTNSSGTESYVMLRLAEQYLIRAEARSQQNNISGAQSDINVIRTRAGLGMTTATTQAALLTAVANERRTEFFVEPGHRFFDLKRTGTVDAVMTIAAPLKGGTWASFKQIWPVPANDLLQDPNLTQAPGY